MPEITLLSTTTTSIEIKLKPSVNDETAPIHGYTVFYKPEFSDWEQIQVSASARTYTLDSLWCGSRYQIYATAYNKYVSLYNKHVTLYYKYESLSRLLIFNYRT